MLSVAEVQNIVRSKFGKFSEVKLLSRVQLFATPWTVAYQVPPSMGFFQARVLEWIAISFSRGSSWPRNRTQVSCIAGRCFTIWATREALVNLLAVIFFILFYNLQFVHLILVILIAYFFFPSCCKHVSLLSLVTVCYPTNACFFIDNFHFLWFVCIQGQKKSDIIQILPVMRLMPTQSPQAGETLFNSISRGGQCTSAFVTSVKVPNKIFVWQVSSSLISSATLCSSMILISFDV